MSSATGAPQSVILKWLDLSDSEQAAAFKQGVTFALRAYIFWVLKLGTTIETTMRNEYQFYQVQLHCMRLIDRMKFTQSQLPELMQEHNVQTVKCLASDIVDYGEASCYVCCNSFTNMQRYMIFEDLSLTCVGYDVCAALPEVHLASALR